MDTVKIMNNSRVINNDTGNSYSTYKIFNITENTIVSIHEIVFSKNYKYGGSKLVSSVSAYIHPEATAKEIYLVTKFIDNYKKVHPIKTIEYEREEVGCFAYTIYGRCENRLF